MFESVHVVGHEDDVEVGDGFEDWDVGDEDSGMFSTLFFDIVNVRDGQSNCILCFLQRDETLAVMMSVMSIAIPKNF